MLPAISTVLPAFRVANEMLAKPPDTGDETNAPRRWLAYRVRDHR
jgi:hypothetical protein